MIAFKNLSLEINTHKILKPQSDVWQDAGIYAILGPNGSGKSSLLKSLLGFFAHPRFSGSVTFQTLSADRTLTFDHKSRGSKPGLLDAPDLSKFLSYLPQNPRSNLRFTVKEVLLLGRTAGLLNKGGDILFHGLVNDTGSSDIRAINAIAESFQITHLLKRRFDSLSGGEKQRVLIARTLVADCDHFIFDEPLNNLDPGFALEIMRQLKKISREKIVTLVLHDLNSALAFADYLYILKDGEQFFKGRPHDLKRSDMQKLYDCEIVEYRPVGNFEARDIRFLPKSDPHES